MEKIQFQIFKIHLIGEFNSVIKSYDFYMKPRPMDECNYISGVLLMYFQRYNHNVKSLDFGYSLNANYGN